MNIMPIATCHQNFTNHVCIIIYTLCRQVSACVLLFHLPCHVVLYKPLYQLSNYNNIAMAHTHTQVVHLMLITLLDLAYLHTSC